MICPACDNPLTEIEAGSVKVDICKGGCGGIWFDNFELKKFDEPHEAEGEALLNIERNESIKVDHDKRRNCPRCTSVVMMRHFFSPLRAVEVDECPKCGGFWLDFGELSIIRTQYNTEEERGKAAEKYFEDLFGKELTNMASESTEKKQKANKIANMFRFLCPSYYIPGKQKGGAF